MRNITIKKEKTTSENLALLFFTVFIVGLTIGSIAAMGSSEKDALISADMTAAKYIMAAFLRNLPFFICAFVPGKRLQRMSAALAAIAFKGILIGCSSVYILLNDCDAAVYAANIFPQLLVCVPVLIFSFCVNASKNDISFSNSTILTSFLRSILVTIFVSCVQFAVFFVFAQFN